MTSIRAKYIPSKIDQTTGHVVISVTHNRETRTINTEIFTTLKEWKNNNNEQLIICDKIIKQVESSISLLRATHQIFSVKDIIFSYRSFNDRLMFVYTLQIIENLKKIGKKRSAENYTAVLNSFIRFRKEEDIAFININVETINQYEYHLHKEKLQANTIALYMRILRAIYNRAVDQKYTEQKHPFKNTTTNIQKTTKRAITLKQLKLLKNKDFTKQPALDLARDIFLFSFYTRGMSFVDMAYLKKKDLANGLLTYSRRKTNQKLNICWEKCMQEIIDKHSYINITTQYLLPIIKTETHDSNKQYKNAISLINKNLKKVSDLLKLNIILTTYAARHTWATIARDYQIPISIISEGLGHNSETTTRIYLASIEQNIIDKANRQIINIV